jgi:hypothetical protein
MVNTSINQALNPNTDLANQYLSLNNSLMKTLDGNYDESISGLPVNTSTDQNFTLNSGGAPITHGEHNLSGALRILQTLPEANTSLGYETSSVPSTA